MPDRSSTRDIDALIERSLQIETRAARVQGERVLKATEAELDTLIGEYHAWLGDALVMLPDELTERFREEFKGGIFSSKIKQFLEAPGQPNPLFPEDVDNPLGIPYWTHDFESSFRAPLLQQRQILAEARQRIASDRAAGQELELVEHCCRRLPEFLVPFRERRNGRQGLLIKDEYDLQDFLHGMLRVLFDDVRPEDWASERAGTRSRIDFVLREPRILVEAKFARAGHGAGQIGDELIKDIERYRSHPDCGAVVAVVYDPSRVIANPATLEGDLSGHRDGLFVRVVVTR